VLGKYKYVTAEPVPFEVEIAAAKLKSMNLQVAMKFQQN
jgi:hypothetical protein